jgi:hypothetical protein
MARHQSTINKFNKIIKLIENECFSLRKALKKVKMGKLS